MFSTKHIFLPWIVVSCAMLLPAQGPRAETDNCKTVERALRIYHTLKPGTTRAEVEKSFVLEGGMQFSLQSRYAYKECQYIKLEVKYELIRQDGPPLGSAEDKVKELSNLVVDYPTKD